MTALLDRAGQRYGRLLVLSRASDAPGTAWLCICDCGTQKVVAARHLQSGGITSCGCYRREKGHLRGKANRADNVTYTGAHKRLYRERGTADEHECDCGERAAQWAYDHQDEREMREVVRGYLVAYSLDPARYRPLCVSCHVRFDREQRMEVAG